MNYPTLEQVEAADRYTLCKWMRFLHLTGDEAEQEVMLRICERHKESGGFTPEISKRLGWNNIY